MTMTQSKILITGGQGMMAGYFSRVFGDKTMALGKKELDINHTDAFERILSTENIECIINAAGLSAGDTHDIYDINAVFPEKLASIASNFNVPFVFLSSSRVFDGTDPQPYNEDCLPDPKDDYGFSKYLGEKLVKHQCKNNNLYIIRLPMVLGIRSRNPEAQVVNRLIQQAKDTGKVSVAKDVFHSPVHAGSAAGMIKSIIENHEKPGLYHITNGEWVSLFDVVKRIISNLNIIAAVNPVEVETLGECHGPINRVLGTVNEPLKETWEEMVKRFTDEYLGY